MLLFSASSGDGTPEFPRLPFLSDCQAYRGSTSLCWSLLSVIFVCLFAGLFAHCLLACPPSLSPASSPSQICSAPSSTSAFNHCQARAQCRRRSIPLELRCADRLTAEALHWSPGRQGVAGSSSSRGGAPTHSHTRTPTRTSTLHFLATQPLGQQQPDIQPSHPPTHTDAQTQNSPTRSGR